jgi:hypothetical protein
MATVSMMRSQALDPAAWPVVCVYCGLPSEKRIALAARYCGTLAGLQVSVCPRHFKRPSRLGLAEWIAVSLLLLWILGCAIGMAINFSLDLNNPLAALAGLLPPLVLLGAAMVLTWDTPAFSKMLIVLALLGALWSSFTCYVQARTPFCSRCNDWLVRAQLGGVSRPADDAVALLREGQLGALAEGGTVDVAGPGDVELALFYCTRCRQHGALVLEAKTIGRKKARGWSLGRWVYPVAAWKQLPALFPKWAAALQESDVDESGVSVFLVGRASVHIS